MQPCTEADLVDREPRYPFVGNMWLIVQGNTELCMTETGPSQAVNNGQWEPSYEHFWIRH